MAALWHRATARSPELQAGRPAVLWTSVAVTQSYSSPELQAWLPAVLWTSVAVAPSNSSPELQAWRQLFYGQVLLWHRATANLSSRPGASCFMEKCGSSK